MELSWRMLGELRAAESRGRRSNKTISQLSRRPQHHLPRPYRAWLACSAAVRLHRSEIDPHAAREPLDHAPKRGRPRATARRPGARRWTRRRASTTLFLAATHISTGRVSSVDAVCDQHDDQEPHMATERRPFGGRSCSWSLAWRGGRSGRRSATRARPSSKCVPARSRYGHVVGR